MTAQWDDAEVLDGLEIIDKNELVGVDFRITSVRFKEAVKIGRTYVTAFVDVQLRDGRELTFTDSSTGVCNDLRRMLPDAELDESDNPMNLVVLGGLRVSEYVSEATKKKARTFFLRRSGKR